MKLPPVFFVIHENRQRGGNHTPLSFIFRVGLLSSFWWFTISWYSLLKRPSIRRRFVMWKKKKETQISWGRYFQISFLANLVVLKGSFNWRILFYFETSSLQSYGRPIEEFQPFSQCNWVRAKNAYRSFYNFCQSFVSTIFFLIKESFHHS